MEDSGYGHDIGRGGMLEREKGEEEVDDVSLPGKERIDSKLWDRPFKAMWKSLSHDLEPHHVRYLRSRI